MLWKKSFNFRFDSLHKTKIDFIQNACRRSSYSDLSRLVCLHSKRYCMQIHAKMYVNARGWDLYYFFFHRHSSSFVWEKRKEKSALFSAIFGSCGGWKSLAVTLHALNYMQRTCHRLQQTNQCGRSQAHVSLKPNSFIPRRSFDEMKKARSFWLCYCHCEIHMKL